jgi:hypothetical protein
MTVAADPSDVPRPWDAPGRGARLAALWQRLSGPPARIDPTERQQPVELVLYWPVVARVPGAPRRLRRHLHGG